MILWFVALPGFLIISSVSGIVNVLSFDLPATACLVIWGFVEAIIIAQWAQWSLDCIMWNHRIIMRTGIYWHQSFWNWGLFSSSAEVSGFLKYEFHIKGTVLYFWSSLRCIKCWIVIYHRGLKYPQRAAVILLLVCDATCTSLNGHCAWKCAVFFFFLSFEWRFKIIGDGKQVFWRY